ncbi:hypothetical protein LEN26_000575 [Aphanomyces euteiches]|nr:hypothetical protein AeMF1_003514 [Aphanomyces euteiches]KAH9163266.1 hypothetical protein LEN26_000575 [Aphanomyces euteiches]
MSASVRLLSMEWMPMLAPAISTVTFYANVTENTAVDCHATTKALLQRRIDAIVQANPWVTGRMTSGWFGSNLTLHFDPNATTLPLEEAIIPNLSPDLDYNEIVKLCTPLEVHGGSAELNKDEPLLRIHWITISDTRGALFVSFSHGLGDGYTYYRLYSMLNPSSPIEALNPHRIPDFETMSEEAIKGGNDGAALMKSLPFLLNMAGNMIGGRKHRIVVRTMNARWIEAEKKRFKESSVAGFVSTNDIVTSWLYRLSGCQVGVMAINLRGRMDGVEQQLAGNYETVLGFQPEDYATPALIRESLAVNGFRRARSGKFPWMFQGTSAAVTSWATVYKSVDLPGLCMVQHLPIVASEVPFTSAAIIFQRTPTSIGVLYGSRLDYNLDNDEAVVSEKTA